MQKNRHFYFFMYFNTIYMIAETGTDPGFVFPRTELAEGQLKAGHRAHAIYPARGEQQKEKVASPIPSTAESQQPAT